MSLYKKFVGLLITFSMIAFERKDSVPLKIASISVTVYHDQEYDEEAWNKIVNAIKVFEAGEFLLRPLKELIDFMYVTSVTSKGIWGGVPVMFVKDAEKINGPKNGPSI